MEITWSSFWAVCRDIIIPESLTVIWNLVLYGFIGILVTILLLVLGSRYKMFTRVNRYYNWAVKLYIPLIIIGTLYFSLQIGLFRGIYKVLDHETLPVSNAVYEQVIGRAFDSQAEKETYLNDLKTLLVEYSNSAEALADALKAEVLNNSVDIGVVDKAKNALAVWLIDNYKEDIFSAVVFGLLSAGGEKVGVSEKLSWSESKELLDVLMKTDAASIETVVQEKLAEMLGNLLHSQYAGLRNSTILLWALIVLALPILEFFIYKRWLEARLTLREAARAEKANENTAG